MSSLWAEWMEAERGRFFPWLAVLMIVGAVAYFQPLTEPSWWVAPGLGVAGLALLRFCRAGGLAVLAVAAGFGAAQGAAWRAPPAEVLPMKAVVLEAVVRGVDILPDGRRLVLEQVRLGPDQPVLARLIRVRMRRNDSTVVAAGDAVQVRALVRPPAPPSYPGAWDLQRDSWFDGVGGGGTALNPVVVLDRPAAAGWAARVQGVRDAVGQRALAALPGTGGAVAATLLTGTTRAIPAADRAAYRDSGLAHLLAVAGLHIAAVMGLFMLVTRLGLAAWPHAALHWPTKAIGAVAALAGGAFYLVLTGGHIPILRSFAMAALVTLGIVAGRRALSLRGLALAAMVLVLLMPESVVGVSFQMSFAAVAALIAGYEAMRPVLARLHGPGWRRVASHAAALCLTSLLAGTASAPYGAYHFGHIQVWFIAANLVAVPITAFWVLPWGMAALLLMPLGLDRLAFVPMGWGLQAVTAIARGVSAWPGATLAVPPMPGWGLAVFSVGLAWLCLWRTRVRLAGVAAVVVGLGSVLVTPLPDILVSNDARLIAWRQDGAWVLQSGPGAAAFTRDSWQEHFAVGAFQAPEGCADGMCRVGPAAILAAKTLHAACGGVALLVSPEPARGVCPGAALVDRFTVWRDGAVMVWFTPGGVRVVSDRAARGARLWVPPPPTPRRVIPDLPMAPALRLPGPDKEETP